MDAVDDIEELWRRYCELENRADRAAAVDVLAVFVGRIENAPPSTRRLWTDECLRTIFDPKAGFRARTPLFQRVLFPELKSRHVAGDAPAARALAQLSQELFRYREGWEALGCPGEIDLWKEAYRRDPSSEDARSKLVTSTARFIRYTLHELPAGVLYGSDGASLEECGDLIAELAFFRGLLTTREAEQFHELVERASFHYPNYREYLLQYRKQGYPAFLAERGHASAR